MFHTRNLLQLLHKTSLIVLLALSIIMLFHIFIMTLGTSLMFWHTDSTPFNVALITFLYYVIPVIALLSFNLIIGQLIHIYDSISRTPKSKRNKCSDIPTDEVKKFNSISEDKLKNSKSRAVSKKDSKKSKSKSRTVPKEDSKKSKSRTVPKEDSKKSKSRTVPKEDSKKSKFRTVPKEDSKKSKSKTVPKGSTKVALKRKQA